jgi:hypothetical protein
LGVCWFGIGDFKHQVDGGLQLVPSVPKYIRGDPHNPERNSNHKDH